MSAEDYGECRPVETALRCNYPVTTRLPTAGRGRYVVHSFQGALATYRSKEGIRTAANRVAGNLLLIRWGGRGRFVAAVQLGQWTDLHGKSGLTRLVG